MNEFLANAYGTTQSAEDQEKVAQMQLFAKLAADNGVDLNSIGDAQVADLWNTFQAGAATNGATNGTDLMQKAAAADAEFSQIKEAQQKVAEADYLGRVMAHAYVHELKKIASGEVDTDKLATILDAAGNPMTQSLADKARRGFALAGRSIREHTRSAGEAVSGAARSTAEAVRNAPAAAKAKAREAAQAAEQWASSHPGSSNASSFAAGLIAGGTSGGAAGHAIGHAAGQRHLRNVGLAAAGAGLGLGAAGGYVAGQKRGSSAIDETAAYRALEKAAESGIDPEEVGTRLDALFTLGLPDVPSKVAAAQDTQEAVEIRSLELLEQVGYPVQWAQ